MKMKAAILMRRGSSERGIKGTDSAWGQRTRSETTSTTGRQAASLAFVLSFVFSVLPSGAAAGATIPGAPQNLAAYGGNGQNGLAWNAPASNGGAAITTYRVFRGTTSSNRLIVTSGTCANLGAVFSCTDTGLTNGQSYDYVVSAVNSVGQGAPSNSATATPVAPATIPGAPSGLIATSSSSTTATLTWTDNSNNETGFKVERKTGTGGAYAQVGTQGQNLNFFNDSGLTGGTQFCYRVRATNATGDSAYSNEACVTTQAAASIPGAPQSLYAVGGNGQNGLGWSAPSSNGGATITSYRVFRGTNSSNRLIVTSGGCANLGAVLGCTDTGLTNGQSYDYVVSAVNSVGQGAPSNSATATPTAGATLPGAPSGLMAMSSSPTTASLTWTDNSNNETGFKVERKTGTGGTYAQVGTQGQNLNFFNDSGLTGGTQYCYRVRATNATGDSAYSNEACVTTQAANGPMAAFTYAPASPVAGSPVTFTDASTGSPTSWAWDFQGDGAIESTVRNLTWTFPAAGSWPVTLTVSNAYGRQSTTHTVAVSPGATTSPVVTALTWQYGGTFLSNVSITNQLTATVDWQGQSPGTVRFELLGRGQWDVAAGSNGASKGFVPSRDFIAGFSPSTVRVTPTGSLGVAGPSSNTTILVVPYPSWLERERTRPGGTFNSIFSAWGQEIVGKFGLEYPAPHISEDCKSACAPSGCGGSCRAIPDWVPYLGGTFDLTETYGRFDGSVSSLGTGAFSLYGQTGFFALGGGKGAVGISGSLLGEADVTLNAGGGLAITSGSATFELAGTLSKEVGVLDAIPALQPLESDYFMGWAVRWFNERAKLEGGITLTGSAEFHFAQDGAGALRWDDTVLRLGADLEAAVNLKLWEDRIEGRAWVGGGGSISFAPWNPPLYRGAELTFRAGAELTLDLLKRYSASVEASWTCTNSPGTGWSCAKEDPPLVLTPAAEFAIARGGLTDIVRDYSRFGPYAAFSPRTAPRVSNTLTPLSSSETSLVSNIFPGAKPALAGASSSRLALWIQQDPALPVLQSTDIAWSFFDGSAWTAPALIQHDTQVEMDPVVGIDGSGKYVAAWLRIKDAAFSTPIPTTAELPLFYTRLEVVSSVFDPVAETWGPISSLTDDSAMDTVLRMAKDAFGNLMLLWLSNPAGEMVSTVANPSTLRYSTWTGSAWTAPASVASGLVGIGGFTAALRGAEGFLVVPRDPDPAVVGDEVLEVYRWTGGVWSAAQPFAAAGPGHRSPSAAYDASGAGHVLWIRGADLVHATLAAPTPQVVKAGSSSAGLQAGLLISSGNSLALVWQEASQNGPSNLYARLFDPASSTWSEDVRLSQDPMAASPPQGYFGTEGTLHLAFVGTDVTRTTATSSFGGVPATIPNQPVFGRADLKLLDHTLIVDLATSDTELMTSPPAPAFGTAATASMTVRNAGDFAVGSVDVVLYAGDPAAGGTSLGTATIAGPFRSGESRVVTIPFTAPSESTDLVAVVDPAISLTEFTRANNTAHVYRSNRPPTVHVTASVVEGPPPLAVSFDASATTDPDGDAMTFAWSFGDGSTGATGTTASHTFTTTGRFPVTVTVTDARGGISHAVVMVSALATCAGIQPPVAAVVSDAVSATDFVVTWSQTSAEGLYEIEESLDAGFSGANRRTVITPATWYQHVVTSPTTYFFRVRAVQTCVGTTYTSAWSAPVQTTVSPAPAGSAVLFYTLPPCRVLDTRNPTGPLGAPSLQPGATRTFDVAASSCGIPATAKAISVNLAVTGPVGSGHLTLYPGDAVQAPLAGTINFSANQTRANNAMLPLASDGSGTIKVLAGSGGTVDFILDVNGYFQ
jgi:PKD repeat protein